MYDFCIYVFTFIIVNHNHWTRIINHKKEKMPFLLTSPYLLLTIIEELYIMVGEYYSRLNETCGQPENQLSVTTLSHE